LKRKLIISLLLAIVLLSGLRGQVLVYSDHSVPVPGTVTDLHFSADNRFLACGTEKGKVIIWDLGAKRQLHELEHGSRVNAVYIDSKSRYVVSAGDNKILLIWDLYTGEKYREVPLFKAKLNHIAVSPDEKTMAVAGSKNEIYLVQFPEGTVTGTLRNGHEKEVIFSSFNQAGDQMVSVGLDNQMIFWDTGSKMAIRKSELSPRTINESGITIQTADVTPDYRKILIAYQETRLAKGGKSMIFKYNTALYDWRTGMLENIFEDHVKKIESITITPDGKYYIVDNSTLSLKKLNFRDMRTGEVVKSETTGQDITTLAVSCTGEWMALAEDEIKVYKLSGLGTAVTSLASGSAEPDQDQAAESQASPGGFGFAAPSPADFTGKYYALIIGINEYDDPMINDLVAPLTDAHNLYGILSKSYTFNRDDILFLKNPKRAEIIDALDYLEREVSPDDNLLIFYAGHGHWDENTHKGYWLPSDAQHESTANWLRNSSLTGYMSSINSKHTLLIADACFSGSIFQTRAAFPKSTRAVERLYNMNSRKAMTSGTLKEVPDESVFLKYLMERLEENQENYLPSEQLFYSLKPAVLNNSDNVPQFGEVKNAGDEGGDFIFVRRK
jgi:WD40 repeat protein